MYIVLKCPLTLAVPILPRHVVFNREVWSCYQPSTDNDYQLHTHTHTYPPPHAHTLPPQTHTHTLLPQTHTHTLRILGVCCISAMVWESTWDVMRSWESSWLRMASWCSAMTMVYCVYNVFKSIWHSSVKLIVHVVVISVDHYKLCWWICL